MSATVLPPPSLQSERPLLGKILEQTEASFSPVLELTRDNVPVVWISPLSIRPTLQMLKEDAQNALMLFDLTAIDERDRIHREGQPASSFTVVYHLMSLQSAADEVRIKVALPDHSPSVPSISDIWPNANWYEREIWDLFGIHFDQHPFLRRILTPPTWTDHPLRKDHHARATEKPPYSLTEDQEKYEQDALCFDPSLWGMKRHSDHSDFMFLNLGPNHPSVHGVFRIVLQLEGERIVDAVPDIGFITEALKKWGNASLGTLTFPTRIAWITSAGL